jgi:hypothetical protein
MRTRLLSVLSVTAALLAGPLATTAGADTPPLPIETGCASGQEVLTLEYLSQFGYRVPFLIDAAGNNDGIVCGVPLPEVYRQLFCPDPCLVPVVYQFFDNNVTTPGARPTRPPGQPSA